MTRSFRVEAPFAVFGFETKAGVVVCVAPIAGYMKGWTEARALAYCGKRGWRCEEEVGTYE